MVSDKICLHFYDLVESLFAEQQKAIPV